MAVLVAINACHGTPLTVDQLREVVGRNYAEEDEQQAGRLKYVAVAVVVTPLQSGWRLPVGGWRVKGALCRVGCGVWGAGDPPPAPWQGPRTEVCVPVPTSVAYMYGTSPLPPLPAGPPTRQA